MEIVGINDTKKVKNPSEVFVEFVLTIENLSKIGINILYFKEHGFNKFLLTYDFNNLKIPMSKISEKISENILKLIKAHGVVIALRGFPKCIFERNFLRPGLRFEFEQKLLFFEYGNNSNVLPEKCAKCMMRKECKGVNENYVKSFTDVEFSKMVSNEDLFELNLKHVSKFENTEIKDISLRILEDFRADKAYMRKRVVYVKSFPENLAESSKERIVYYIYNHFSDFEKTYDFILSFFEYEKDLVEPFKIFLENSEQFALSFAKMGDFGVRKSFYFDVSNLSENQLETLTEMIGVEVKMGAVVVGFDFKNEAISYKVYYNHDTTTCAEIKEFISNIPFEKKKMLMRFANSLTKPVNNVFFDYKFKDLSVYSKRIDVSLQYNNFRLMPLSILLGLSLRFFEDKDMYTLSFEVSEFSDEKINFYYALKLPEEFLENPYLIQNDNT